MADFKPFIGLQRSDSAPINRDFHPPKQGYPTLIRLKMQPSVPSETGIWLNRSGINLAHIGIGCTAPGISRLLANRRASDSRIELTLAGQLWSRVGSRAHIVGPQMTAPYSPVATPAIGRYVGTMPRIITDAEILSTPPDATEARRQVQRLARAADNMVASKRETPQRFIPLARRAARDLQGRLGLIRYLLSNTIAETKGEHAADANVLDLLERLALAIGDAELPHVRMVGAMEQEVLTLAPRETRRRSHHCHGQLASDRRLLLVRAIVDEIKAWPTTRASTWYNLYLTLAYAMSDYDCDHFEMVGLAVERRIRRLAQWVEGEGGLA